MLAEHVVEHLTSEEAERAARNVFEFLRPGGYWRVAVPDANNPSEYYREWSRPEGLLQRFLKTFVYTYPDHKVFCDVDRLTRLLVEVGFAVSPLEYYDEFGNLCRQWWRHEDGRIKRAVGTNYVERHNRLSGLNNTSLIVDAYKPGFGSA